MEKQKNIPRLRFREFSGEWEKKKLVEIGEIVTGLTPPTANHSYYNGNFLFVSPVDIQDNRYVTNTITTLTQEGFLKGRKISVGATMFVCIGSTIGKVAQAKQECITNQQINSILPFKNNNDFVFSLLEYHSGKIKLLSAVQAVPIINKTTFSNYYLSIPLLPEQQKIASFFTAIDQKSIQLKRKKTLLEQYKKGVMQKIFSQEIRFKDDNGQEFSMWEKKRLGDISNKKASTISANTIEENSGVYPIYGATGFLKKVDFFLEENDYISIVKDGAGVGRLLYCEGNSSVLGTLDIIRPKKGINTYFLYLLLSQIDFTKFITGSTIPHIYYKDYSKNSILVPCPKEQTKIANFLSAIDDKIINTQKQIEKAEVWKKGLMQQMFV